jgi:hypothetical protein
MGEGYIINIIIIFIVTFTHRKTIVRLDENTRTILIAWLLSDKANYYFMMNFLNDSEYLTIFTQLASQNIF